MNNEAKDFPFSLIVKDCWSEGDGCDLTNSSVAFCLVIWGAFIMEFFQTFGKFERLIQ